MEDMQLRMVSRGEMLTKQFKYLMNTLNLGILIINMEDTIKNI